MLLVRLRRILLQDCALLQQTHPHHFLFKHEIFQSPAFATFAERVRTNVQSAVHPRQVILQEAMPQLADAIDAMRGSVGNSVTDLRTVVMQETSAIRNDLIPVMEGSENDQKRNGTGIHVVSSALGLLAEGLRTISTGVFETRLRLMDEGCAARNGIGEKEMPIGSLRDGYREKDVPSGSLDELLSQLEKAGVDSQQVSADMINSQRPDSTATTSIRPSTWSDPPSATSRKVFVL